MIVYGGHRGAYRIVNGPAPSRRPHRPAAGAQARVAAMIERRAAQRKQAAQREAERIVDDLVQLEREGIIPGIDILERALGLR
jgi:hypothetical protein